MVTKNISRGTVKLATWLIVTFSVSLFLSAERVSAQTTVTTPGGTIYKIPKWNSTTGSLIDSLIYENVNVGINTMNPAAKLDVVKDYTVGVGCGGSCWGVYQQDMNLLLRTSNTSRTIDVGGAIGFTDSSPGFNYGAIKGAATNSTANEYGGYLGFYTTGSNSGGGANGYERMRIDQTGKVGIGTTTPTRLLHIRDTSPSPVFTGSRISTLDSNDPVYELLHENINKGFRWRLGSGATSNLSLDYTSNGFAGYLAYLTVLNTGNVGIGTTNPLALVHVGAGTVPPVTSGATLLVESGVATSAVIKSTSGGEMFLYQDATNGTFGTASTHPLGIRTNNLNRIWIEANGNVGINTMSPQNALDVNGTISGTNVIAKYQDVAEWVPANRAMPAGTVVTLDPEHSNLVVASSHSYDTRVAGVVSEKPGVILGEGGEGKVMIATTGRVRVKVDATNAPIRVGDLLVTSDKEGIAMRSQPLDLGGTPIHRPGTLIGKALEPLAKGVGQILVLLSLQ